MEPFEKNSEKKIFLIGAIVFLALLGMAFFLPKKSQKSKKVEVLKEKEKIEREIKEAEKEKEEAQKRVMEILEQTRASEDGKVRGVEIEYKGEKKVIRNNEQGYSIEIFSKMLLAQSVMSDELKFFIPDKEGKICCPGWPGCQADLTISVEENKENLRIEEWVKKNRKEIILQTSGGVEAGFQEWGWQKIGNNDWYKTEYYIEYSNPIPTLEYFLPKGNKIYVISIPEWEAPLNEYCPQKMSYREVEKLIESFQTF
jgi:cell division protein FtsL